MAWMVGVDKTIIANDGNSKLSANCDVICLHTIVGSAPASAAHFSTNGAGKIWQHRDTIKQSAANYNGNGHIIAIENEDRSAYFPTWNINDGHAVPGFTNAQIEAIAQICAWANKTHGIPLVQCPDSKRGSRGIAYHRQGIDGNWAGYAYGGRVAGGEVWTTSKGKVCPGDRRIAQIPQIIARAKQIVGAGGEDMSQQDVDNIKGFIWEGGPSTADGDSAVKPGSLMYRVQNLEGFIYKGGPSTADGDSYGVNEDSIMGRLKAAEQQLNRIEALLTTLINK